MNLHCYFAYWRQSELLGSAQLDLKPMDYRTVLEQVLVLVAGDNLWIPASFFGLFDRCIIDIFMSSA